ncbi:MAG: UDP-N-acetylglucosamine 4,6-dehydratase (inverting) [Methanobacteriota archaeon]|nr:MAG: UDP-N-acetylglucosamine 4,6-dehydratase (inverting) [Euryarchaeota archaeon]
MAVDDLTILVTGGTGSFGQKFTELVLADHRPKAIRIYSRDEWKQVQMQTRFNDPRLRFLIGDVRDRNRLSRAMNGVDVVIHAAALKQVPVAEYNPIEAVRTNIEGAVNVIDAAIDNGVSKVLALSSDKAVHPVNLYGATKLVAEKLIVQANSYSGPRKTRFSVVRYGNVIGSRGSVVPVFRDQARAGTLMLTDERMTRFWITQEQAVRFILGSLNRMQGGEIFVPKIPSMRVADLARAIAPDAKRKVTGIRPGEKLHETLLTEEEAPHSKEFEDQFVIEPEHPFWSHKTLRVGKTLAAGFRYTSDGNKTWLSVEELKEMLKAL